MVEVLADERMYEFTGGEPPTLDRLRQRYRAMARGRSPSGDEWWLNWIVRWPADPVGVVQATVTADRSRADVAWEVGVPWQGQGIAGEAAQAMVDWLFHAGVSNVRACVHPEHAASAAIAARIGLAPSEERIDGEVVWVSTAPERSVRSARPESPNQAKAGG